MTTRSATWFVLAASVAAIHVHAASAREAADATGDAADPAADLATLDVRAAGADVLIVATTTRPYAFSNTQLLLDTDRNATTGFADADCGFDLLVEGANLFRFQGTDQTQWTWQPAGEVQRSVAGNRLSVRLSREKLIRDDFDLVVRTLNEKYAEIDRAPDTAARRVVLAELDASPTSAAPTEAAGDADDGSRDLTEVALAQRDARINIDAKTRAPADFAQLLVFFDTDDDAHTGYKSGAAPDRGFDFLLSGGRIHRFNGDQPGAWAWEGVEDADVSAKDNTFRASFNAATLKSKHAQVVVMAMSADWQTVIDRAPNEGAFKLAIDVTKIPAGAGQPPAPEMAEPRSNRDRPARERFAAATSFCCYYGSGQVAALSHFDILVAHSPQMRPADIASLKALGVVVVGYLTVGEDDKLRTGDGTGPGGYASWYFDEDGDNQPDQNGIWKSYYANASDPAWRTDRVAEAKRLCAEEGYDGIFLDTLDTASSFPKSKAGMVTLVTELRAALPNAPIVLNQGFPMLATLAPFADGLMIESFTATYDFKSRTYVLHSPSALDWTRGIAERIIAPVRSSQPLQVLVVDYALPTDREHIQAAADRAATFGYLFQAAPITLDMIYPPVTGQPDEKWRARQATPEALQYALGQSANGFPAGTMIRPSGCYGGYRVAPVVDGIRERGDLYWADAAWASAEDGDEAWLEFRFPQPTPGKHLRIRWAVDSGRGHASRRFRVEVERAGEWIVADAIDGNDAITTEHRLPAEPFDAVRIRQSAGDGSATRPNLMWIAQVELLTGDGLSGATAAQSPKTTSAPP